MGKTNCSPLALNPATPSPVVTGFSQEMNLFQKSREEPRAAFWREEHSVCPAGQGGPSGFIANHSLILRKWEKSIHELDKGEQHLLPHQTQARKGEGTVGKRGRRLSRGWLLLPAQPKAWE